MAAGIDADIVLKVSSKPANSQRCNGAAARATAHLREEKTMRPVYGVVELCQFNFVEDLDTTIHEVLTTLVRLFPCEAT